MFVESIIAAFCLGMIVALVISELGFRRAENRERQETAFAAFRQERQRLYRSQIRKEHLAHLGTPYIADEAMSLPDLTETTDGLRVLLARIAENPVVDDHVGSRRVALELVEGGEAS